LYEENNIIHSHVVNIYEQHLIVKNGIRVSILYFMHNIGTVIEISRKNSDYLYNIILYTRAVDEFTRSSKYIYRTNDDSQ